MTDKQKRFVDEYCLDFNATKAAIRAGYSKKTARSIGSENLSKPDIKAAIKEKLDLLAMPAEEAMKRLSDIARGSVAPFLLVEDDGIVRINLGTDEAKENYSLLRKIKQTRNVTKVEDITSEEIKTEFELHDAKDALTQILKIHGKFVEKVEHQINPIHGFTLIVKDERSGDAESS